MSVRVSGGIIRVVPVGGSVMKTLLGSTLAVRLGHWMMSLTPALAVLPLAASVRGLIPGG